MKLELSAFVSAIFDVETPFNNALLIEFTMEFKIFIFALWQGDHEPSPGTEFFHYGFGPSSFWLLHKPQIRPGLIRNFY